jgi:hypothetical protein
VAETGRVRRLTNLVRSAVGALFDQDQPFGRLALVHTIFSGGTTLVTISLAGSLFFSVTASESKSRVLLYLLLTIAPFAVVAPLLSPLLDRGATARRAGIGVASGGSAVLALFMASDLKSFLLFPEAFGILVLSKLYLIGKAALVPSMTETDDDLASANAKLAVLAAVAGFAVSPIGVGLLQLGAQWVLRLTFVAFVMGAVAAVRLPRPHGLPAPSKSLGHLDEGGRRGARAGTGTAVQLPGQVPGSAGSPGALIYRPRWGAPRHERVDVAKERRRLGLPLIVPQVTVALGAMTVLRACFGFLTFFLAFALKNQGAAAWWYGFILLASGIGGLLGSVSVPVVRRRLSEQGIILAALCVTAFFAVLVGLSGSRGAQPVLALVVGLSSTGAKPAFDSIAQTYVPPAALGRAFARFETQLQLGWVLSALLAVIFSFQLRQGDILIAAACAIAAVFHRSMRPALTNREHHARGDRHSRRSRQDAEPRRSTAPLTGQLRIPGQAGAGDTRTP